LLGRTLDEAVSREVFVSQISERLVNVDDAVSSSGPYIKIVSLDVSRDTVDSVLDKIMNLGSATQQCPFRAGGFPNRGRIMIDKVT
jgi:hypothetical protein